MEPRAAGLDRPSRQRRQSAVFDPHPKVHRDGHSTDHEQESPACERRGHVLGSHRDRSCVSSGVARCGRCRNDGAGPRGARPAATANQKPGRLALDPTHSIALRLRSRGEPPTPEDAVQPATRPPIPSRPQWVWPVGCCRSGDESGTPAADEPPDPARHTPATWPEVASAAAGQTGVADLYSGRSKNQSGRRRPELAAARTARPVEVPTQRRTARITAHGDRYGAAVRPANAAGIPVSPGAG